MLSYARSIEVAHAAEDEVSVHSGHCMPVKVDVSEVTGVSTPFHEAKLHKGVPNVLGTTRSLRVRHCGCA